MPLWRLGIKMDHVLQKIIYVTIFGVILVAILLGLRSTALKSAYDASTSFTVTDSANVTHTVAASGISGDTVATLYGLAAGLVMLAVIIVDIMLVVSLMKVKGR